MVKVSVKRDGDEGHAFVVKDAAELLSLVDKSRHFREGGTIEDVGGTVVGSIYPLKDDMEFTWFPPQGRSMGAAAASAVSDPLKVFLDALDMSKVTPAVAKRFFESAAAMAAVAAKAMTPELAKRFYTEFSSSLNTLTKLQVQSDLGYKIDGVVVTGAQGQAKSSLHVAFRDADVVCVKAYALGTLGGDVRTSANLEGEVSRLVHGTFLCTTVVEVERVVEAGSHVLVVMPLLGKSAAELQNYSGPQHVKDCAVLIDLASCTLYGRELTECTKVFGLGLEPTATLSWDLTCLASSLYMLSAAAVRLPDTVQELEVLSEALGSSIASDNGSLGCQLCHVLLKARDTAVEDLKVEAWDPCINIVKSRRGLELASALEARWPVRKHL